MYVWQVLTASVINPKTPQVRNIISQDYFVAPRELVNSFNDLILFIRVIKEGAMERKTPRVGQVVHQDDPLRTIHISSFDLKETRILVISLIHTEWNKKPMFQLTFSCMSVACYHFYIPMLLNWSITSMMNRQTFLSLREHSMTHSMLKNT